MNKGKNQGYGNALKKRQENGFSKKIIYIVKIVYVIDQLDLEKNNILLFQKSTLCQTQVKFRGPPGMCRHKRKYIAYQTLCGFSE